MRGTYDSTRQILLDNMPSQAGKPGYRVLTPLRRTCSDRLLLVDRGWVKANNFRRSDNKWAYAYLLTPRGMSAKLRLTSQFLQRKEREFEALQSQIKALRVELSNPAVQGPRRRTQLADGHVPK